VEIEACDEHQAIPQHVNEHAINDLSFQGHHSMCVGEPRYSSRFWAWRITVLSQPSYSF